jgi:hypothetical protein
LIDLLRKCICGVADLLFKARVRCRRSRRIRIHGHLKPFKRPSIRFASKLIGSRRHCGLMTPDHCHDIEQNLL